MRAFSLRAERSTEAVSLEGQGWPFSNAGDDTLALEDAEQLPHGSRYRCPEAVSHNTGNNTTNVIFTRSITTLTTQDSTRSFRFKSATQTKPGYYKPASQL